jgi:hypothetical protein
MMNFWTTGKERSGGNSVYQSPMERLYLVGYDLDGDALVSALFFYEDRISTQASFVTRADRLAPQEQISFGRYA